MNIAEICSGLYDDEENEWLSMWMDDEDGTLVINSDFQGLRTNVSLGRAQIGQLIAFLQWAQLRATDFEVEEAKSKL